MSRSRLFEPLTVRGAVARNRIWVSPMCTYSSGDDGRATDFHLVHLGRFALGGAGTVVVEATAVERRGRISARDLGLWDDDQVAPLRRVADFLRSHGAVPALQLAHAGRRAGTPPPWDELFPTAQQPPEVDWPVVAPTAEPSRPGRPVPSALTTDQLAEVTAAWAAAARRVGAAGFDLVEIHGAHGYLLHSFLSPLSNHRTDAYGGSPENRMRFPLEVVAAVRAAVGDDVALSYRLSSVDGVDDGLEIEDTVAFAKELVARGVDLVDTSSGGLHQGRAQPGFRQGYGYHAAYSRAMREVLDVPVVTVGLVVDPHQAEALLEAGDADLVAIGREALVEPNWAVNAAIALGVDDHRGRHPQAGWYLHLREAELARLRDEGQTPLSPYGDA